MDASNLLNYNLWADEQLSDKVASLANEEFTKDPKNVRSIRQLVEHHITGYDYLILPGNELKTRMEVLSKMNKDDLLDSWKKSREKFVKKALILEEEIEYKISEEKTVKINKDDYLLLYTDHLTYHRGQLTHAIKSNGHQGVNTDYYSFFVNNV